jgi:hypothetical protein
MKKRKATEAAPKSHRKDTAISTKKKVLSALSSGEKFTAQQLNEKFYFNDSRKVISVLRHEGYNIEDCRLLNGCKQYWLVADAQLSLEI